MSGHSARALECLFPCTFFEFILDVILANGYIPIKLHPFDIQLSDRGWVDLLNISQEADLLDTSLVETASTGRDERSCCVRFR
jgi:hypothetical protein